jgi:hypothetical protein
MKLLDTITNRLWSDGFVEHLNRTALRSLHDLAWTKALIAMQVVLPGV